MKFSPSLSSETECVWIASLLGNEGVPCLAPLQVISFTVRITSDGFGGLAFRTTFGGSGFGLLDIRGSVASTEDCSPERTVSSVVTNTLSICDGASATVTFRPSLLTVEQIVAR